MRALVKWLDVLVVALGAVLFGLIMVIPWTHKVAADRLAELERQAGRRRRLDRLGLDGAPTLGREVYLTRAGRPAARN